MASELRVNTLKDAAGNNSIATSFVAGGSAKLWCNWAGSATVNNSFNTASVTDNGTGNFSVNTTNAFANVNYCRAGFVVNTQGTSGSCINSSTSITQTDSTTVISIEVTFLSDSAFNGDRDEVIVHGDLA